MRELIRPVPTDFRHPAGRSPGGASVTRPAQRPRRDSSEPLLAAMASVMALMEETARIQRDTAQILRALSAQSGNQATIQTLASGQHGPPARPGPWEAPLWPAARRGWATLHAEPSTAREETVLRLLHGPLSLREIGQVLSVSHNTIKSHTRAIYRKLGVSNRREAIQRCRQRVSSAR